MNPSSPRSPSFYNRSAEQVATDLLGDRFRKSEESGPVGGTITETEAYLSTDDDANHALQSGKTDRTSPMFGPPGTVYVYLIYGMYHCLNITCQEEGTPEAVLIRALRPETGRERMRTRRQENRTTDVPEDELASGPGKLCMALGIDRAENETTVCGDGPLTVLPGTTIPDDRISTGPRVGVEYADTAGDWPLRFQVVS